MSYKTELIALAVRVLAEKTSLIRKPDPIEDFINNMFGFETYDQRVARSIEAETERAIEAVKRIRTNRKFKKITENVEI